YLDRPLALGRVGFQSRPRVLVAATDVAQREWGVEARRLNGRSDEPDFRRVAEQPGPGRHWAALKHLDPEERPIDKSGAVAGHDDRFLAEVTALGIAHRPDRPGDLHDEPVLADIHAVNGRARFDAKDFERPFARRSCPGRQ